MSTSPAQSLIIADDERLLTTKQLAEYLKMSVQTIYNWPTYGYGPRRIKIGKHTRFMFRDVTAWLEEQSSAPISVADRKIQAEKEETI